MALAQSIALTMLVVLLALAPLIATLMWWLQPQPSLSESIHDAWR